MLREPQRGLGLVLCCEGPAVGRHGRFTDRRLSPQPEVLHMIYLRALQMVYGTRLEHFYMVGARGCRRSGGAAGGGAWRGFCDAAHRKGSQAQWWPVPMAPGGQGPP